MKIRIVDTDNEFNALEGPWNRLSEKTAPNFFSSFDYVRTAWKHFRGRTDRLYILVLSEGPSIVGIAPFYINIGRYGTWRIPHRTIRWIATWEGDRPRLLVDGNEEIFWNEILRFLRSQESSWDVFDVVEQSMNGPEGHGWSFLPRSGWYWEKEPDAIDYYVSLEGSWEDYLKGLGSDTRNQWRRKTRRLSSIPGGYAVERIFDSRQMQTALARFVSLERSGWKAEAGIGAGKDKRHLAFYEDLLVRLAGKGEATIHFLTSKGEDIAGWICFIQRDVVYFRHTAYSPAYAAYSPGIIIQAEIIQELFRGRYRELDLLGMREDGTVPRHKTEWATGRRETVHLTAYRVPSRLLPLVIAKRLKHILMRRPAEI
jgi:CelD/BcsL family acetyltransferase involved in cellulose biosynthesis